MRARIGLLGCGTVGRGFVELVDRERERIRARTGVSLEIAKILVRDVDKPRGVDRALLTTSALDVIDAEVDVVVELVGGVHCAGAYVRRAIDLGRDVVTANKALLAAEGRELFAAGRRRGVRIGFEASVCGGVPVVRALQRGLAGDSIESIAAILNGTCNYILTRMEDDGLDFSDALAEAQGKGFAEADPSLDIDGWDAAAKTAVLANVWLGAGITPLEVRREGISADTAGRVAAARARGRRLKLVASATRRDGLIDASVELQELDPADPLASLDGQGNAIEIDSWPTGRIVVTQRDGGLEKTAYALMSDLVAVARHAEAHRRGVGTE